MINFTKRSKITVWVIGTIFVSIVISFLFSKDLGEVNDWFFVIPNVISIELIVYWLFTQHLWKWKKLYPWLVPFPNLTGSWVGELHSSFIDLETNCRVAPINCMLVIKHDYEDIHVTFITKESKSYSFSEELNFDKSRNYKQITYCYANEPKLLLDKRSSNHKGTAILSLIEEMQLEGLYYSDRETKGEMYFKFYSKKLLDKLPNDLNTHPMDGK